MLSEMIVPVGESLIAADAVIVVVPPALLVLVVAPRLTPPADAVKLTELPPVMFAPAFCVTDPLAVS